MNRLQGLDAAEQLPGDAQRARDRIDPDTVLARMDYEHPIYTPESVAAQRAAAATWTPTGPRSPAPTTAGASTRTAAAPAWGRRARSG